MKGTNATGYSSIHHCPNKSFYSNCIFLKYKYMVYIVVLINWKNKLSNYSTLTLKNIWILYSFYWSFQSILLCKINNFTEYWDLKKAAVRQRCLIKLRFWLAVEDSNWPLLTGGRCSQVVVKSGLTVLANQFLKYWSFYLKNLPFNIVSIYNNTLLVWFDLQPKPVLTATSEQRPHANNS